MKQYREDPGICVEDKYIVQNLCISCDESLNVLDPMIVKEVIFVFDMFFFSRFRYFYHLRYTKCNTSSQ